jgi:hypothetical protein
MTTGNFAVLIRLDLPQHLHPVQPGHVDVEQQQQWSFGNAGREGAVAAEKIEGFLTSADVGHLIGDPGPLQVAPHQASVSLVVFSQQDRELFRLHEPLPVLG